MKRHHAQRTRFACRRAPHGARGLKRVSFFGSPFRSCRAPHGARGLKLHGVDVGEPLYRRAPHGASGLKPVASCQRSPNAKSRPAWGAWIETLSRRSLMVGIPGRAPHGARGLKLLYHPEIDAYTRSRPARGAWIETEKLGERIVKSSATFPYRMLFRLGLKNSCPVSKLCKRMMMQGGVWQWQFGAG